MAIALSEHHEELARTARALLAKQRSREAARDVFGRKMPEPLALWPVASDLGWLGLHIPEENGGSGFGLMELAVVLEELGYGCAPGPYLPTVVVSAGILSTGSEPCKDLLPALADGSLVAGLGLAGSLTLTDGRLQGSAGPVVSAAEADVLALAVGADVVIVDRRANGIALTDALATDPGLPCSGVVCESVEVAVERVLAGASESFRDLFRTLASAVATGGATACMEMATEYAKARVAFGRPIGQFQAVKHHCANMLIEQRLAAAASWNACRDSATAAPDQVRANVATSVCLSAFLACAQLNIQVHGGIGFTWEHDAHLFLRKAIALNELAGGAEVAQDALAALPAAVGAVGYELELPEEALVYESEARRFLAEYNAAPPSLRHAFLAERGYLFPHLPQPWGREAGPLEQLVIDWVLEEVPRTAGLGPCGWSVPILLPTLLAYATAEQSERWIWPTLKGEIGWCVLMSEPEAGSDLASLTTRARRTDGGWLVSGQKVWTSTAHQAHLGLAFVRTSADLPRRRGITAMVIQMDATGIDIRPLRQITGAAEFNEVFFDEVFVPDTDVVGEVNQGWQVLRTSLDNERVHLGEGGFATDDVLENLRQRLSGRQVPGSWHSVELGRLLARASALRAVNARAAQRTVAGLDDRAEGNVTKLVRAELAQQITELGLRSPGARAAFMSETVTQFLQARRLTIAGGTSEILRNAIAERLLGLPRDPPP